MVETDSNFSPKVSHTFVCDYCDYKTCKSSDFKKHLSTDKHKKATNDSKMVVNDSDLSPKVASKFQCECGKFYKYDSGYYRHIKKCNGTQISSNMITTELVMELIKDNKDLKKIILEQNSTINNLVQKGVTTNTSNNSNNVNSMNNNKTFNLQFFLNETCKDAMNIMDFVDSLKIQLSDLENFGTLGYVDGISKIIIQNLKLLDEDKRPVHCTDSKREIMYVKDENKWEKEDENKQKMRKVIKHVTHKNTKLFKEFKEKYPGCEKSESRFSNKYDKLIVEAFGGKGDNDVEKEDKIIRNIAKNVTISK